MVQETINSQKEKITRILGNITQEDIDNLGEEIVGILVGVNSNHLKEGCTNGHLDVIVPVEYYHDIIGGKISMYDPPVNINTYNPTADNVTEAVRVVKEAE